MFTFIHLRILGKASSTKPCTNFNCFEFCKLKNRVNFNQFYFSLDLQIMVIIYSPLQLLIIRVPASFLSRIFRHRASARRIDQFSILVEKLLKNLQSFILTDIRRCILLSFIKKLCEKLSFYETTIIHQCSYDNAI